MMRILPFVGGNLSFVACAMPLITGILPLIAGVMIMIAATQPCFAQTLESRYVQLLEFEVSNHPNPDIAAFYQSNSDEIAELLAAVNDRSQGDNRGKDDDRSQGNNQGQSDNRDQNNNRSQVDDQNRSDNRTHNNDNHSHDNEASGHDNDNRSHDNKNSSHDNEARLSAFAQLVLEYPIAATVAARELVSDDSTPVALQAVRYLMNELVMSDHDLSRGTEGFSSLGRYIIMSHKDSRTALLDIITDPRPELRDVVAPFFASLSDLQALEAIIGSPEFYSDVEAALLITLSSSKDSLALLEQYLSSDDPAAQVVSVEYLATIPQFQDRISSEVFLNRDAYNTVRLAAAESLGLYDNKFTNYALIVAGEQGVSPDLYRSAVSNYVEQAIRDGLLGPNAAGNFANQIGTYIGSIDDPSAYDDTIAEIRLIKQRLKAIAVNQL